MAQHGLAWHSMNLTVAVKVARHPRTEPASAVVQVTSLHAVLTLIASQGPCHYQQHVTFMAAETSSRNFGSPSAILSGFA